MKKTIIALSLTGMIAISLTGCTSDVIDAAKDAYNEATSENVNASTQSSVTSSGTILYKDGSTMGVTIIEAPVNGGFQIYNLGTGEVAGFIGMDNVVYNLGGMNLGVCTGAEVTDQGMAGDCTLSVSNPNINTTPIKNDTSLEGKVCSFTDVPKTDFPENCPDTRNGDFNPNYSPSVCNANGYFWCSLSQQCLDKPVNVPTCGEIWER